MQLIFLKKHCLIIWHNKTIMKKLLFISLILASLQSFGQLEDIVGKMDIHAGYSFPLGKNYPIKGGISIDAEPKFWYNESLVFGAKIGMNFLQSPASDATLAPITNLALVGEKYSGEGDAVFFYGASAGGYFGGHIRKYQGVPTGSPGFKFFGIAPRAGIQFGQYRLMAEYHLRFKQFKVTQDVPKFATLSIGYTFGGE